MRLAAILLVGAIAALLDTTIVNVAIRTIGQDLNAPLGTVQWVMTGYLLSYGMWLGAGGFGGRGGVLIPLTASAVLLASFVAWALRPHRRVTPLIDLRLLQVRSFSAAAGLMFISGLSMYGALFLLPLYYQQVRGASALGAGLLLAPQGIGALLPRTLAGTLTDWLGPGPWCWPAWRSRRRAPSRSRWPGRTPASCCLAWCWWSAAPG